MAGNRYTHAPIHTRLHKQSSLATPAAPLRALARRLLRVLVLLLLLLLHLVPPHPASDPLRAFRNPSDALAAASAFAFAFAFATSAAPPHRPTVSNLHSPPLAPPPPNRCPSYELLRTRSRTPRRTAPHRAARQRPPLTSRPRARRPDCERSVQGCNYCLGINARS